MAQPQLVQIKLSRFDAQPWGFRLQGGVDFASPLLVQKVNGGSLAENAGLLPGDAVIKINDVDVYNMRHKDAQDIVVRSGNNFVITVQRGGSTWRPHVAPTGTVPQPNQNSLYLQTVTKTSLAHKQQDSQHIGCGYNNAARPFTNGSGDGNVKSIVNKQYNTPVGIYSDESIAETLSAQAEVLAGGVLGVNFKKNEKEYQADKSEVLKFLREEETGHTTPAFGHSQHYQDPSQEQHYQQQPQQQQQQVYHHPIHQQQQQQQHHQQHQQQSATRHVNAPINTPKPPSTGGLPTGQNICTECERLITGVFVRIKDKNLHVECFKCATCGTSLKNQGYYNFNNKLYCEIHAKLAAQQNPPAGTEGYVPVPIKPNTKLSANTISSALSSHGYNGVSNGNAVSSHAPEEQFDNTDLPLPPPPSPTQLLQLETGSMYSNNHTYTHNVVDGVEAASPVLGINSHKNYHLSGSSNKSGSTSTCSTLSLDGSTLQQSISPIHSPQSGYVVNNSVAAGTALGFNGDNLISTTTNTLQTPPPPPPPPPLPLSLPTNNNNNNYKTIFNENKENKQNTYNRTPLVKNAYNQLLKEYSNKMQTQSNYNGNGYNNNNNKNMTPKPFRAQSQLQSKSVGNPSNFDNLNNLSNSSSQAIVPSPSATVVNTLNSVENNQSIDLQKSATVASSMPYSIASNVSDEQTNSNNSINVNNNDYDNGSGSGTDRAQDQPFRYVTLTGNVIRSVMPPGKGTNINYKVNQGYARPFGAPASAPKSPVSFPPQPQQQWGASQPAAPRPAVGNSYATLPRSSIGQSQEPCVKTNLKPVAHNTIASNNNTNTLTYTPTDTATTMLEESLSKIKMGDKMKDFMAASGQVISNMLEARLANQQVQQEPLSSPSQSSSSLSVRSNSSSNLSRSPLQMRKRYDLNGFGNLDHIEPAALKPALKNAFTTSTLTPVDNTPHALGKVLDICDNNVALPTKSNGKDLSPLSPLPLPLPPSETVIYRNNVTQPQSDRRSTHARDRRSYIESGATQNGNQADAPAFSISVKALGRKSANGEEPLPLSPENEELVSELIKDGKQPICCQCNNVIEKGPFITALGRIWCPEHFICVNANCRRPLQDIGFVEEKGDLYCEYCFEKYLAPSCSKCNSKIKGDCLNAIGRHFHPECFTCAHCGKIFGNTPFFLEDGNPYCEADWNELFTTKCFACGFPVEAGDRWVEALNHNYHSQCFNCTYCKQNLEGQSFYNKGGRPFCKNHAR